ncbi:MAG: ATP-binding protein, partial [Bacteroidaceae bacterium]|nr:ATP-binding protein [Bacteroidaceae bacterium]
MRNRFLLTICLAVGLSFCLCNKLKAYDDSHHHYQQFSVNDGLTHQSVTALMCDTKNGLLWVGTDKDLNLIVNGYVFPKTYFSSTNGSVEIGRVNKIVSPVGAQKILVSTDKGVLVHEFGSKILKPLIFEGRPVFADAIACNDDYAYIYSADDARLLKYDFNDNSISIVVRMEKSADLHFTNMLFLQSLKGSILLVDKEKGLFLMDLFTGQLSHLSGIGGDVNANAVFQDMYGTLWVAKYNKGVYGYKPLENFRFYKCFTTENSLLPHNNVTSISETSDSHLCLGTDGAGLCYITKVDNDIVVESDNLVTKSQVIASFNNDIVVGTQYNGLVVLRKNNICVLKKDNQNGDVSLSNTVVSSMYDDDGKIWIGTMGGGINCFDEAHNKTIHYPETEGKQISAITEYDKDHLLIYSLYDNIYLFNKTTGKLSAHSIIEKLDIDYENSGYHNLIMCNSSPDFIYAFNMNGRQIVLDKSDKSLREFSLFPAGNGSREERVIAAFPLSKCVVIITDSSIYEVDNITLVSKRLYSSETRISSASIDGNGNVWFINAAGVYKYNRIFNELTLEISHESDSFYTTVLVDKFFDRVWLANSSNELLVMDRDSKVLHHFSFDDGLPYRTVFFDNAYISGSGYLYFPSSSGLCVVNPVRNLTPIRNNVSIQCLSVLIDNDEYSLTSNGHSITVPSKFKSLFCVCSVLPINPVSAARLQYTLKEGDNIVFQSETDNPSITISKLGKGNFVLYGSVFGPEGWIAPVKLIEFRVLPSFFDFIIPIFVLLSLLVILVCVFVPVIQKRKESNREREMISKQEEIQRQMALTQAVAFKSVQSIGLKLKQIGTEIQDIQNNLRLDVALNKDLKNLYNHANSLSKWLLIANDVLNPEGPHIELVVSSIQVRQWIDDIVSGYKTSARIKGIDIKVICPDDIQSINADREKLDFVLSVLLDNAIKFSDGGTIQIVVSFSTLGNVKISVIDEGRGIEGNPEDLFKPLFRGTAALSGLGLNLYAVKVVVERMNGQVGAYNNMNKGATFYVALSTTLVVTDDDDSTIVPSPSLESVVENELMTGRSEDLNTENTESADEYNDLSNEGVDPFLDRYSTINPETDFNTLGYTLLVVDDQQDNLDFLKEEYSDLFKAVYVAH